MNQGPGMLMAKVGKNYQSVNNILSSPYYIFPHHDFGVDYLFIIVLLFRPETY